MTTLAWRDVSRIDGASASVHVQRAFYPPGHEFGLHDHDFAEVFCLLDAPARHRGPAGDVEIQPGTVGCIAPRLTHALAARSDRGCTFLNIAFPAGILRRVLRDYPALARWWPSRWPAAHARLGDDGRRALLDWGEILARPDADELAVHAFVLDVCRRLRTTASPASSGVPPTWLAEAVAAIATPAQFAEGVRALARVSGRGGAHINRLVRRHYGVTANQLVNRLRMDHAALRLRHSDDPVLTIAGDCGFATPAQFYRQFQRRFRIAPRAYRERRGSVL